MAYRSCPALVVWGEQNAQSSGYRFALDAPGLYAKVTWNMLPLSLAGESVTHVPDPVPPVSAMVFPARKFLVPGLFGGLLLVVVGASVAGAWRRRTLLLVTVWVANASVVSTLAGLLYSAGALDRFGIQEAIGLRLALLSGVLVLAEVLLERYRERSDGRIATDGTLGEPVATTPPPVHPAHPSRAAATGR